MAAGVYNKNKELAKSFSAPQTNSNVVFYYDPNLKSLGK